MAWHDMGLTTTNRKLGVLRSRERERRTLSIGTRSNEKCRGEGGDDVFGAERPEYRASPALIIEGGTMKSMLSAYMC